MTSAERKSLRAWLELLTASNSIKKQIDANLRSEFGMSISRFDILSALDRAGNEGLRASDLSKKLFVTEGATTQIVAPLVRDELVLRTPCKNDGRAVNLKLTKQGRNLFTKMARIHKKWIDETFSGMSPEQVSTLRQLLSQIDLSGASKSSGRNAA